MAGSPVGSGSGELLWIKVVSETGEDGNLEATDCLSSSIGLCGVLGFSCGGGEVGSADGDNESYKESPSDMLDFRSGLAPVEREERLC